MLILEYKNIVKWVRYYYYLMQTNSKLFADLKVSAMAFSPDAKSIAVALKFNNLINIYTLGQDVCIVDNWKLVATIKEQTQQIGCLDWSNIGKILSCSHDRSVIVWRPENNGWVKELANIDNKLSVLVGVWAPNGKKFAIGSSDKDCYIGFYNREQNFWSGKIVAFNKKDDFQSSITSLAFHQSGNVIAVGSSDFSFRVLTCNFSSTQEAAEAKQVKLDLDVDDNSYKGKFDNVKSFGVVLLKIGGLYGWINHLTFWGNNLAIFIHNNKILIEKVHDQNQKPEEETTINWKGLPFLNGFFKDQNTLVAGGYDKKVAVFKRKENGYEFANYMENSLISKFKIVERKSLVGEMAGNIYRKDSKLDTTKILTGHQNPIRVLRAQNLVFSYDVNGIVNFWES